MGATQHSGPARDDQRRVQSAMTRALSLKLTGNQGGTPSPNPIAAGMRVSTQPQLRCRPCNSCCTAQQPHHAIPSTCR